MLFNSNIFLYVFLPLLMILTIGVYKLTKENIVVVNYIVLLFSLIFYVSVGGWCVLLLLMVVAFNYIVGMIMEVANNKKIPLIFGIVGNIGVLFYFKYAAFAYDNVKWMIKGVIPNYEYITVNIVLPVGVSFFTFQAMSYVIDVYKGEVQVQRNPFKFALYIALFPQLIAGPIVRYATVEKEINSRRINTEEIFDGLFRFSLGLSKKVIIADFLGSAVDKIWVAQPSTIALAWSAAFLYTLQIFYDFSGYSDMAIGLGRMLGFHFAENFIRPYTAENVTDFWRRWHVSLSSFLRDYLYIPLGGNRKGKWRTYLNLFIIFFVCGLWHGAAWNFVVWGLYHGLFMIIERVMKNKYHWRMQGIVGRLLTFIIVMIGWVMFRATSIVDGINMYKNMIGLGSNLGVGYYAFGYFVPYKVIFIALAAFTMSFCSFERIRKKIEESTIIKGILMVGMILISMVYVSDATFTPFIYFQF